MAKFKHPLDIEPIPLGIIYSIFYLLCVTPFLKNPCKTCLVQAACSKECVEKIDFDTLMGHGRKIWEAKLLAGLIWLVFVLSTIGILI